MRTKVRKLGYGVDRDSIISVITWLSDINEYLKQVRIKFPSSPVWFDCSKYRFPHRRQPHVNAILGETQNMMALPRYLPENAEIFFGSYLGVYPGLCKVAEF